MSKYIGPKCRLARREKVDLELKSRSTSFAKKCKADQTPGEHSQKHGRQSNYGLQLREKQKIKRIYGLREFQFTRYYATASRGKSNTGAILLFLLEKRLDNIVYRMGFAHTRAHARQIVSHKGIMIDNRICNIPSRLVKVGNRIEVVAKCKEHKYIQDANAHAKSQKTLSWLDVDHDQLVGVVLDEPNRAELSKDLNEQLVIEFYSGKK